MVARLSWAGAHNQRYVMICAAIESKSDSREIHSKFEVASFDCFKNLSTGD